MADMKKLKEVIKKKNLSVEFVAEKIGIDRATFYRKVNSNGEKFTVGEVNKMAEEIGMTSTEVVSIFLPENSQERENPEAGE